MRIFKRQSIKSTSWGYDIYHDNLPKRREQKSGFKTKSEATNAARERLNQLDKGFNNNKKIFTSEYMYEWIKDNKLHFVSDKTYKRYEFHVKTFLEHFGNIELKKVTRNEYQKFLNKYGKTRAHDTVKKLDETISQIFESAVYNNLILKSPTHKVERNYTVKKKSEIDKYLQLDLYLRLLDHLKTKDSQSSIVLYLMCITGARVSEILNLTRDDIKYFDKILLPGTKSDNAKRIVTVNPKDLNQIKEKIRTWPVRINKKIFNISNNAVNKALSNSLKSVGASDNEIITSHGLRHTHASYLIYKGFPAKFIQHRLGHSDVKITLEVYAHLFDQYSLEMEDKVKQLYDF